MKEIKPVWGIAGLIALILIISAVAFLPDGRLHVVFLDAGLGDAVFIQTPSGRQIFVDGGAEESAVLARLGDHMPFWDRHLDAVVLAADYQERKPAAAAVLERYTVDYVATGAGQDASLLSASGPDGQPVLAAGVLAAGTDWALDDATALRVLWPDAGQAGPLVLQMIYGQTRVLLPGDATSVVEEALTARYSDDLRSDALLIPRHGAATAAMPEFVDAVAPAVAVISADGSDRFPSSYVLARLSGMPLYRTDIHGDIEIVSNGRTVQVKLDRH